MTIKEFSMKKLTFSLIPGLLLSLLLFLPDHFVQAQNKQDNLLFKELEYRNIGPTRGGRVTAVTGDKNNDGVFYIYIGIQCISKIYFWSKLNIKFEV